ncbi:keratin-associated protein 5-1-like [Tripterygium wilfordii]|uniref:keratin-associated protein 5-1-like n=1 Tax=Tripterygium wilfordii TaxID=458696 RepID=UPI0018F84A09|nr:keratin-associated protein 5-1-like [Tripterygium wilfordii]
MITLAFLLFDGSRKNSNNEDADRDSGGYGQKDGCDDVMNANYGDCGSGGCNGGCEGGVDTFEVGSGQKDGCDDMMSANCGDCGAGGCGGCGGGDGYAFEVGGGQKDGCDDMMNANFGYCGGGGGGCNASCKGAGCVGGGCHEKLKSSVPSHILTQQFQLYGQKKNCSRTFYLGTGVQGNDNFANCNKLIILKSTPLSSPH